MKKLEAFDKSFFNNLKPIKPNLLSQIVGGTVTTTQYKCGDKCCNDTWDTSTTKSHKPNGEKGDLTKDSSILIDQREFESFSYINFEVTDAE